MTLVPADADFAQRVRASFARQAVMQTLSATLDQVDAGKVVIGMPHSAAFTQQHGFLHAGIVATVLDSACGYAAFSLMPVDAAVLTIEFKVNLLRPARGAHLRCVGQVTKAGRSVSVVDGQAWQPGPSGDDELVATMTATVMTVIGRDGLRH